MFQTSFSSICILEKAMYWKVLCQINRIYWANIHPPVDDLWQFKCHYFGPQKPEESWRSVTLVESYWSLPPFEKIYGQILSLAIFCPRWTVHPCETPIPTALFGPLGTEDRGGCMTPFSDKDTWRWLRMLHEILEAPDQWQPAVTAGMYPLVMTDIAMVNDP